MSVGTLRVGRQQLPEISHPTSQTQTAGNAVHSNCGIPLPRCVARIRRFQTSAIPGRLKIGFSLVVKTRNRSEVRYREFSFRDDCSCNQTLPDRPGSTCGKRGNSGTELTSDRQILPLPMDPESSISRNTPESVDSTSEPEAAPENEHMIMQRIRDDDESRSPDGEPIHSNSENLPESAQRRSNGTHPGLMYRFVPAAPRVTILRHDLQHEVNLRSHLMSGSESPRLPDSMVSGIYFG